jgi:DNA adenine methylase
MSDDRSRSILLYHGGKTRGVSVLAAFLPQCNETIYSPFFGGGSVELHMARTRGPHGVRIDANDVFEPLMNFWSCFSDSKLRARVLSQATKFLPIPDGDHVRSIRDRYLKDRCHEPAIRAAAYLVVNRVSFNGGALSAGVSMFKAKTIEAKVLSLYRRDTSFLERYFVGFHNLDWTEYLDRVDPSAFLFLDPPYYIPAARLYGNQGDTHRGFDHAALRDVLRDRPRWVLCYNDCAYIRELYGGGWCCFVRVEWPHGHCRNKVTARDPEVVIMPLSYERAIEQTNEQTIDECSAGV